MGEVGCEEGREEGRSGAGSVVGGGEGADCSSGGGNEDVLVLVEPVEARERV